MRKLISRFATSSAARSRTDYSRADSRFARPQLAGPLLAPPLFAFWLLAGSTFIFSASRGEAGAPEPPISYAKPIKVGELENSLIHESSGLAISRISPDRIWTHNDSGDGPSLYCLDKQGKNCGTTTLAGVDPYDWEDMCSFQLHGRSYLLVADVGDNAARRESVELLLFPEPEPNSTVQQVSRLRFRYESGPVDCEAVGIDPVSRQVLLVEKRLHLICRVFALQLPAQATSEVLVAKRIATIRIPIVTAMDISPDGRRAVVLTLGQAFEFTRDPASTWADAFSATPRTIDMPPRRQGESICFDQNGRDLWLTSEQLPTPLFRVPAVPNPRP